MAEGIAEEFVWTPSRIAPVDRIVIRIVAGW